MKPIVHYFHAHPPHHGARYYWALAAGLLAVGLLYLAWAVLLAAR